MLRSSFLATVLITCTIASVHAQSITITSDRGNGFCANVTTTNTTSQTQQPWGFSFGLSNATITSFRDGQYTVQNNQVSVTPPSRNLSLAPNTSATIGFCASGTGRPTLTATGTGSGTSTQTGTTTSTTTTGTITPCLLQPITTTNNGNTFKLTQLVTQCILDTRFASGTQTKLEYQARNTITWINKGNRTLSASGYLLTSSFGLGKYRVSKLTTTSTGSTSSTGGTTTSGQITPFSGTIGFAPYVDMLLWPTPHLPTLATDSGAKKFVAAFMFDAGSCTASWGGIASYDLNSQFANDLLTQFTQLRSQSGEVIVSLGGANGTELAVGCTTVNSTYLQYKAIVQKYNLSIIDFDIEGYALGHSASNIRRAKALKLLQTDYPHLQLRLTLPTLPSGLTSDGVRTINEFIAEGVRIDGINIMAMDYGAYAAPNPGAMGQYAINASQALFTHLRGLYPSATTGTIWSMIGITPMIGLNDVSPEVFSLADAQLLKTFAGQQGVGMLSMWSLARDKSCANNAATVSYNCSGVPQTPYQFSSILR